jgi:hypothetical protein
MTTRRTYQAGYESVLEKLAVSIPWIEQRAARGAVQRIKKYDFQRESLIPTIANNIRKNLDNTMRRFNEPSPVFDLTVPWEETRAKIQAWSARPDLRREKRDALHEVLATYNKGLQEAVSTDPGRLRTR